MAKLPTTNSKTANIILGIVGAIVLIGLVFVIVCAIGSSLKDLSFAEYVKQLFVK